MGNRKTGEKIRILLTGAHPFALNRGVAAMCMAGIDIIKRYFPVSVLQVCAYEPEFLGENCSSFTQRYGNNPDIVITGLEAEKRKKSIGMLFNLCKLHLALSLCILQRMFLLFGTNISGFLYGNRILRAYLESDVILDFKWGDRFTDIYGANNIFGFYRILSTFYESLIPVFLNKPYILLPQSIGPFRNRFIRSLAGFILRKTKIIMVRERKSLNYLFGLGISPAAVSLVADAAFCLEAITAEEVNIILRDAGLTGENSSLVGITLRDMKSKVSRERIIDSAVKITEQMRKSHNCSVIFIPHDGLRASGRMYREVLNSLADRENVYYLEAREYSAEELRGVIGRCAIHISAYLHANISAFSMLVPTLSLASGHKAEGVFALLGQEKYVLDIDHLDFAALSQKAADLWNNREKIRRELQGRVPPLRQETLFIGEATRRVLGFN
jgi:polysaccharide pyruvyl transferase WcaK-like protein